MPFKISKVYAEFNAFAPDFIAYLTANETRLGIPTETLTELGTLQTAWNTAWQAYSDHATQNQMTRNSLKGVYKDFHARVRSIQQSLKNSDIINLITADYDNLAIHRNKTTRTPAPKPTIAPDNTLLMSKHLYAKVSTFQPDTETEHRVRLPKGIASIRRELAITDEPTISPTAGYEPIANSGRSVHTINFADGDVNKFGWLKTAFVNSRGDVGPNSNPLKIPIF